MAIEYIFPTNIDDRILRRSATILEDGGLIAYPTDTTWSIGASSESKQGLARLSDLRGKGKKFPFTLTCASIEQMNRVSDMDDPSFRLIKRHVPGPFVFILPPHAKIEKLIGVKRPEVGVRLPDHPVPVKLALTLGAPLLSITASRSLSTHEWREPGFGEEELFEMGWEVEEISGIDLVLDAGEALPKILSTVVDLTGPAPVVVRSGAGVFEY